MRVNGGKLRAYLRRHRVFAVAVVLAAAVRVVAMLGYRPVMWFNDSYEYVSVALHPRPHPIRPDGYGFWLLLLKPFHSFGLVAITQHLMGLGIAVLMYALLRRRFGLPGWGATLATLPVLFDAYQIQLEHLVLSDVMFTLLVVGVVTLLLWHRKPTVRMGVAIGLLLALVTLTRTIGMAILVLVGVYLLVKRAGWRPILAIVLACGIPVVAYMGWFKAVHGKFAMTGSDGLILYMRTMAFAECAKMKPPPELVPLCNPDPPDKRKLSQYYLWSKEAPVHRYGGYRFTELNNELAGKFARQAILTQPADFLRVTARDFLRTFQWDRKVFPDPSTYEQYEFGVKERALPGWALYGGKSAASEMVSYEKGRARTTIVSPWADFLRSYQDYVYLRGTLLGGILLVGLAGLVQRWRRLGGPLLLPWLASVGLLLAPAATAEFDYRYVLPAVPLACLAAAITLRRGVPAVRLTRRRAAPAEPVVEPAPPKELIPTP
ncbi:hypothetical protein [Bailinhaonella thermotolerans]|uniref:hypothetical protein n=1 Tax=Bailinhaonella thermotolerans TaxID=1070861 RepID=UPI00192A4935|nr:hypothetical protein [Bailinhaonella thermotolerans]